MIDPDLSGVAAPAAPTVLQAGRPRSARIESLRGIAAVSVLGAHVFAYAHGWRPEILHGLFHRVLLGGGLAVQLFFALSGYLMYRAFARRDFAGGDKVDLLTYARNRALRLLPLYWAAVIVLLLATAAHGTVDQWWRFLLFAQNLSTKTAQTVDGPMWSLVVELHFYLLVPLLAWVVAKLARGNRLRAIGVFLLLGGASVAFTTSNPSPAIIWKYSLPGTFYAFVPGLILAILQLELDERRGAVRSRLLATDLWLMAGAGIWILACWQLSSAEFVAASSFLVVGAVVLPLRQGRLIRLLDLRGVALVGVISYSLYIWHVPIIEHLVGRRHVPHGTVGLLLVVLPLSLAVAAVSYIVIERPALRYRGTWARAGEPPLAVGAQTHRPSVIVSGVRTLVLGDRHVGGAQESDRRVASVVLGTALFVRVVDVAVTRGRALGGDAIDYDRLARRLAAGHGFGPALLSPSGGPTAFRPPLYPLFLSVVYRITGDSVTGARALEAIVGVATVALVGLVGWQLFGRRAGFMAAALAAVYPPLVLSSVSVLSEALYVPLELLALFAALKARQKGGATSRWVILAGTAAGFGILTRPNTVLMVPLLAILVVARRPDAGPRSWSILKGPALVVATALVVVAPWQIRNQLTMPGFVPISDIDGFNLAGVYNPSAAHAVYPSRLQFRAPSAVPTEAHWFTDRSLNEVSLSEHLRSDALTYIRSHPASVPEAVFWNSYRMLELARPFRSNQEGEEVGYGQRIGYLATVSFWLLLALATVGIGFGAWRKVPRALRAMPAALWVATVPVLGTSRLRVPIEPFLVLSAAIALDMVLVAVTRRRSLGLLTAAPVAGS